MNILCYILPATNLIVFICGNLASHFGNKTSLMLLIIDGIFQAGYSLRNFSGHSGPVMSLDFHPNKDDLICSCDGDGEIRYWSIKDGSCVRVFKVRIIYSLNLTFEASFLF